MSDTKRLATAALLAVIIAIVKGKILPPPLGDLLVIFEAMLLGLSFILIGSGGATYTAAIAGLLINFQFPEYGPLPFLLALLYGVLVDFFSVVLKVKVNGLVSARRLSLSLTVSSAITGPVAYYLTLPLLTNAPSDTSFYATIILIGVASGAAAGFLAARIWERNLKGRFASPTVPAV